MQHLHNRMRGKGLDHPLDIPFPSCNSEAPAQLLRQCPAHAVTPLVNAPRVAQQIGANCVWIKDERKRMGLGSFKALGAAYVIACDAVATQATDLTTALSDKTYITASAGNHGLSVAAGARVFGARSIIYIAETVPEHFAERLKNKGAEVVRAGSNYEQSMALAQACAVEHGYLLLSDSSWTGYTERPYRLMEGYLQMAAEAFDQCPQPPTHIFLQAGVGGLAGAVAALARVRFGAAPRILIVEPDAAPALFESIKAGAFVPTTGPVSAMGRLDCKEASLIALQGLARDADDFITLTEEEVASVMPLMADVGLAGSESGIAGVAGAIAAAKTLGFPPDATALFFLTEGVA